MDEKLLEQVTEIQKNFVYDEFKIGDDYTIYHCHKPGTNVYSFEIVLGKLGIYVGGDIDALTFKVSRGLDFLAGNDISYYIRSKLEHEFYSKVEFRQDLYNDFLLRVLWEAIENETDIKYPESWGYAHMPPLEEMVSFYQREIAPKLEKTTKFDDTSYAKAWYFYEKIKDLTVLNEIYSEIFDSKFYAYDGEMPTITQPDSHIMFRLYMVNHAAKKILATKKDDAFTKTET